MPNSTMTSKQYQRVVKRRDGKLRPNVHETRNLNKFDSQEAPSPSHLAPRAGRFKHFPHIHTHQLEVRFANLLLGDASFNRCQTRQYALLYSKGAGPTSSQVDAIYVLIYPRSPVAYPPKPTAAPAFAIPIPPLPNIFLIDPPLLLYSAPLLLSSPSLLMSPFLSTGLF